MLQRLPQPRADAGRDGCCVNLFEMRMFSPALRSARGHVLSAATRGAAPRRYWGVARIHGGYRLTSKPAQAAPLSVSSRCKLLLGRYVGVVRMIPNHSIRFIQITH